MDKTKQGDTGTTLAQIDRHNCRIVAAALAGFMQIGTQTSYDPVYESLIAWYGPSEAARRRLRMIDEGWPGAPSRFERG